MAAAALQETSQRGTILVSTQRFKVGDLVFEEDALFDSSPALNPERTVLVSELCRLSRKGVLGVFTVAQHLAAIVVAELLTISDLKSPEQISCPTDRRRCSSCKVGIEECCQVRFVA
mmetsp:Transcript_79918/g.183121  ORF Transcript_79918/g.183121 Transcript_79918/m.183121 type:complete len:117 (-) Transcript_79918:571-921(-)